MSLHESLNSKVVFEVYKKIQLSKFPTVSSNLRQFLRFKKQDVQTPKIRGNQLLTEKNREEKRSSSLKQRKVPFAKPQNVP